MNCPEFENIVSQSLLRECGVKAGSRLLVALSGGADSVALLRVLLSLGYNCVAAHCNFHLRGEESMRDERFARQLCSDLGVPLRVKDFDVDDYRNRHGVSVEMACRELRYRWFDELLGSDNCAFVAVAHHRDDNIETMFLNLLRGTGIAGMTGMKPCNGKVVRPMLGLSRKQVLEYLDRIGQDYVTDSTNEANDYQRNKVRNVILRDVDTLFPDGRSRIADTMRNLMEWHELYAELAGDIVESGRVPQCDDTKAVYSLAHLKFYPHPKLLLFTMLSVYGFNMSQCEQMAALINDENRQKKAHFYSSTNAVTITKEQIVIEQIENHEKVEIKVDFSNLDALPVKLEVSRCEMPFNSAEIDGKFTVAFDARLLDCENVVLRRWKDGDRMRPYGMNGTRLLSDIFSDAHLTLQEKRCQWLLEANGEILWVLGRRASAEYQVLPTSSNYIKLRYHP